MANKRKENPFLTNDAERVLQKRMKHARRMTRDEFIQELKPKKISDVEKK